MKSILILVLFLAPLTAEESRQMNYMTGQREYAPANSTPQRNHMEGTWELAPEGSESSYNPRKGEWELYTSQNYLDRQLGASYDVLPPIQLPSIQLPSIMSIERDYSLDLDY